MTIKRYNLTLITADRLKKYDLDSVVEAVEHLQRRAANRLVHCEFGNPDVSELNHRTRLERIMSINMSNVVATVESVHLEENGDVTGEVVYNETFDPKKPMGVDFHMRASVAHEHEGLDRLRTIFTFDVAKDTELKQ